MPTELTCPYCGAKARLTTRREINSFPEDAAIYLCGDFPRCDAYVGCHKGTTKPLGSMADGHLRVMRRKAHAALDWAWKSKKMSRSEAYRKLGEHLELKPKRTHIGMFNLEQCQATIDLFKAMRPWKTVIR